MDPLSQEVVEVMPEERAPDGNAYHQKVVSQVGAKNMAITCGTLRVELDHLGVGKVFIDDKKLPFVRRLKLNACAGKIPLVEIEYYPIPEKAKSV